MKKTTLTLITLLLAGMAFAQSKPTVSKKEIVAPVKPQYQKVVQIPVDDFSTLVELANHAKQRAIYEPNFEPAQAVDYQKQIDAYLKELGKRIKLDSIKVDSK